MSVSNVESSTPTLRKLFAQVIIVQQKKQEIVVPKKIDFKDVKSSYGD
jgi:hypothetical protein